MRARFRIQTMVDLDKINVPLGVCLLEEAIKFSVIRDAMFSQNPYNILGAVQFLATLRRAED